MRKISLLIVALLLALAAFGCSSDDDGDDAATRRSTSTSTTEAANGATSTTETPALDPDEVNTSASPYCATWGEIRTAGGPPSQDAAAVKKHYGDLLPTVEKLLSQAPSSVKSAVRVALESTQKVAKSGNLQDFQTPEVQSAQRSLSDYAAKSCAK